MTRTDIDPMRHTFTRQEAVKLQRRFETTVRFERHRDDCLYSSGADGGPHASCSQKCPKRYGYTNHLALRE